MSRLLTIILLLGTLTSAAQIPHTNALIVGEADSYIGQRVGGGVCKELLDTILIHNGLGLHINGSVGYYSFVLDSSDTVYPGDVVIFKNVVLDFGKVKSVYKDHLAIVYAQAGNNTYYIVHQNHGVSNPKKAKVVVTKLDLNKMVSGEIEFRRAIHL